MGDRAAPTLEMLWESGDPRTALAERFGYDDPTDAGDWVATMLDEHWGLRVRACERIVMSGANALAWVDTDQGRFLAKWSVAQPWFPRLHAAARVTHRLAAEGLPVSPPVPTPSGRLQCDDVQLTVQREVSGTLLDTTDPVQVRAAGQTLGRLHEALSRYRDAEDPTPFAPPSGSLRERISTWLESPPVHVPDGPCERLRRRVRDAPADVSGLQAVHFDFRSANILWDGRRIVAVLDFEEMAIDHAIVDLARSAVLLGTRYHDWAPLPREVRSQFVAAYREERPLSTAESFWLETAILWYSLMMIPADADPAGWARAATDYAAELTVRSGGAGRG